MHSLIEKLDLFSGNHLPLLLKGQHGLEKECLRTTAKKEISEKRHPKYLGSPLFHPHFSTDFGEAQLELITPPFPSLDKCLDHLEDLHIYLHHTLGSESLWPSSIPCRLPNLDAVHLASFGMTSEAYKKWLYRKGLSLRYGKAMQLLSGIHYNFSFSLPFWKVLKDEEKSPIPLERYITEKYFHLCRNFLRMGWIISYLFGASPSIDRTFLKKVPSFLKKQDANTLLGPYATSIRMSQMGYFSQIQAQNAVSFNSLKEYTQSLNYMLKTTSTHFEELGVFHEGKRVQINDKILQIEAEHYCRIRPKPKPNTGQRPIDALNHHGVNYIETRILDLNPFIGVGVDAEPLDFMHLFFVYCLFKESPPISKKEAKVFCDNQNQVALFGRKKGLKLFDGVLQKQVALKNWAHEILDEMHAVAKVFDQTQREAYYQDLIEIQKDKVDYPYLTPSGQLVELLIQKKQSFVNLTHAQATRYRREYKQKKCSKKLKSHFEELNMKSIKDLDEAEAAEDLMLPGYEEMEFSTQMILKEAMRQGIDVKILDRKEHIIELKRGKHIERIKQATQTRLDPLISYFLMENKEVTKKILRDAKIHVPRGALVDSWKEAKKYYQTLSNHKVVVKPNLANMGEGISFVEPHQERAFEEAFKRAHAYNGQVLIEEFFEGDEYRLLVVDGRVVASCKRMPAHVQGDGKSTLQELIMIKNKKNEHRQGYQKPLSFKEHQKELKKLGFSERSILNKGEVLFLRENSNVSTGGESIDVTDLMPEFYKRIAVKAAKSMDAKIAGVDVLIKSLKSTGESYRVIEVNFNPALYLHRAPSRGKARLVEKDILKALGF